MEGPPVKRKRTANFTSQEKLKFVQVMSVEGQSIISKVKAHDASTNREKEEAWHRIAQRCNESGEMMRQVKTLKKLWGKMKTDARSFKADSRHSMSGTNGHPPNKIDFEILKLVAEIIGCASTGNLNNDDSDNVNEDDNYDSSIAEPPAMEYLDVSMYEKSFPEHKFQYNIAVEQSEPDYCLNSAGEASANQDIAEGQHAKWANHRRPDNDNQEANELTKKTTKKDIDRNRFAAEQLRAEKEKTKVILLEKRQRTELHNLKMENEQIKNQILKTLLRKVTDADNKDACKIATELLLND